MAEKLGLKKEGEAAFMGGYLKRVRELPGVSEEERDYIGQISGEGGISVEEGEILVHQAQYMLFDNSKLSAHVYCLPKHLY